jgi:phosphate transport system protein
MTAGAPEVSSELVARARIDDLRLDVVRLASLTTSAIGAASEALATADLDEADGVIRDDDAVDAQRHAVEDACMYLLGHADRLEGNDLRFVVCTLRVAHELERAADLMVNVARSAWRLYPATLDEPIAALVHRLGRQAAVQIRVAVNAFVDGDTMAAAALADMDDTLDELHDLLVRRALVRSFDGPDDAILLRAVQLTLVARHYERAGDHAVTIAEFTPFVVTGTHVRRPHTS